MKFEKRLTGRDSLRLMGRAARFISTSIAAVALAGCVTTGEPGERDFTSSGDGKVHNAMGYLMEPYSLEQEYFQVVGDCPPNASDYMSMFTRDGEFRISDTPHSGIDFDTTNYGGYGVRVKTAAPGRIVKAGKLGDVGGYTVVIFHGYNSTTGKYVASSYSHLNANIPVKKRQHVFEGETIGQVGSSGNSYYPALHFGVTESDTDRFLQLWMVSPHKYWWQEKPGERKIHQRSDIEENDALQWLMRQFDGFTFPLDCKLKTSYVKENISP